jgi:type IV pilus assembly protein PilW
MKQMPLSQPFHNRGLTIVELLVAMALALLMLGVSAQVYMTNKSTYNNTEALARIQENGRFAIEFLTKEIRMAGLTGCKVNSIANAVNGASSDWKYDFNNSVLGYEGGVDAFPSETPPTNHTLISGSDAIVISRGEDTSLYVNKHEPSSAVVHLTKTHDIQKGEILMIVDCLGMQAGIFQQTQTNNNNTNFKAHHNKGGSTTPGNCTKSLKGNFTCVSNAPSGTPVTEAYDDNSKLLRMRNSIFYIATGRKNRKGAATPSLYRTYLTHSGGGAATASDVLVEGIEDFQILYGIDTDPTADGIANQYVTANNVTSWNKVASVRLFVLARSIDPVGNDPRQYTFMGTKTTATDGYVRKQFTATIQVRNHGLGL